MTDSTSPESSPSRSSHDEASDAAPTAAELTETADEYLELSRSLRRLAVCVADSSRADDLVQEAWLAALDTPPGRIRDLNAWLRRVLRRIASRERRRDLRRQDLEWMAREGEPEAEEPATVELGSTRDLLQDAVAELKPHLREALEQRFFQERSVAEIAARLDCPQATVRTRLRRGIQDLRSVLDRSHGGVRAAWAPVLLEAVRRSRSIAEPAPAPAAKLSAWAIAWRVLAACLLVGLPVLYVLRPETPEAPPPAPEVARLQEASAPVATASEKLPEAAVDEERVAAASAVVEAPQAVAPEAATEATDVEPEGEEAAAPAMAPGTRELELVVRLENGLAATEMDAFLTGSGSMGPFHSDEEGRLRIPLRPDQLDGPPLFTGEHGGVTLTVRARGYAWSDHYMITVPPEGRRFEVATRGPAVTLRGRVADPEGRAVAGARVEIVVEGSLGQVNEEGIRHRPVMQQATTDADGHYELDGLVSGAHTLRVLASGFLPRTLRSEGPEASRVLDFALSRGASISGVVVLEDGTPVQSARVWAPPPEDGGETVVLSEARTDEFGLFELQGVRPGSVWILAHAPRQPGLFASRLLEVDEAEPMEIDLILESTPGVRVRVVDPADDPVGEVLVMLYSAQPPYWGETGVTDATGDFHFPYAPDVELYLAGARFGELREGAGEITGVTVSESTYVLRLPGRIDGEATFVGRLLDEHGEPFEQAVVHGDMEFPRFGVQTDPVSGDYEAMKLGPGPYLLTAVVLGRGGIPLGTHELHDGETYTVEARRASPPGRLVLDWGEEAPGEGEPWSLRFRVPGSGMGYYLVQELNEPLVELELYPGTYVLAPPGELGVSSEPFQIVSGETTTAQVRR